jgi:glycosyltransferase involved in cell wall biosynthesis
MLTYSRGWHKQQIFVLPQHYEPKTFISIIIPARNESRNIGNCIDSILAQRYPRELFEIIVVDDHSEDDTAAIVKAYAMDNVHSISLAEQIQDGGKLNSYKKAALAAAIRHSKGELIVTTDADCTAPNTWLSLVAARYEQDKPAMIVGPVTYTTNNSIVQLFQLIDFMSMQGITAAAHALKLGNMSNGANLAFAKSAYNEVNGYEGIDKLASGDDYLLMMKINKKYPGGIAYLKSPYATMRTLPQPDWRSFLQQRIRWASKSGKYDDKRLTAILLLVYLFNVAILAAGVAAIFNGVYLSILCAMLVVKIVLEFVFLIPVARFFNKEYALSYFIVLQPLHVLYIVIAGFLGFAGKYEWKGRKVR